MPPKKRAAVSLDDVNIDFSAVAKASEAGGGAAGGNAVAAQLLPLDASDSAKSSRQVPSDSLQRAFDPALAAYAMRHAAAGAGGRRRTTAFGGPSPHLQAIQEHQHQQQQQGNRQAVVQQGSAATRNATASAAETIDFAALRAEQASAATDFIQSSLATAGLTEAPLGEAPGGDAASTAAALTARRESYAASLKAFCQEGLPWRPTAAAAAAREQQPATFPCSLATGQSNSLLCQLFVDGVPDIEPWDRWAFQLPRYDPAALIIKPSVAAASPTAAAKDVCDLVHHPLLPASDFMRRYQHAAAARPVEATLYKTKEELKAERRERLKKKQEEKRKAAAQAAKDGGLTMADAGDGTGTLLVSRATPLAHDRLSNRNLVHNMLGSSVLNPIAAESKVLDQYQQRFLEHQQRNHERHVAALPNQIVKREKRVERQARENPVLRAYRIYPIYGQAHLGKLRNFANDCRLRGVVVWVGQCDAVVVLAGGEVAARHLDRWILHKMEWESRETRAVRLCSVPLQAVKSFSFHLKRAGGPPHASDREEADGDRAKAKKRARQSKQEEGGEEEPDREPVYMNQCATVQEAEAFLREIPVDSPWPNLSAIWRAAFLADGLAE